MQGIQDVNKPSRPVLRWFGGKWKLAPWIISHFPEHEIYTEAFGGAGSVLIRKPRAYSEVWNEFDGGVVNLFRVLRDPQSARRLIRSLYLTPYSRVEFNKSYEVTDDPVEAARRQVVKSLMGFGSNSTSTASKTGFRTGFQRRYTTPASDWVNYPKALSALVQRLRGVIIENRDAARVLEFYDGSNTLHYVDPPYVHSTRGDHHDSKLRYAKEMSDDDHEMLAALLNGLTGMVVLSGYQNALYGKLYSGWKRFEKNFMAQGAKPSRETLWLNKAASSSLKQCALWD